MSGQGWAALAVTALAALALAWKFMGKEESCCGTCGEGQCKRPPKD